VKEFYQANYRPESSAIALVGDFNSSDMKKLIEDYFGGWKNDSPKKLSDLMMVNTPFNNPSVYLINKDNATETTFMIGSYGTTMNNEDQTQLMLCLILVDGFFTG
jgi:predicted Zn-dependent peptidase